MQIPCEIYKTRGMRSIPYPEGPFEDYSRLIKPGAARDLGRISLPEPTQRRLSFAENAPNITDNHFAELLSIVKGMTPAESAFYNREIKDYNPEELREELKAVFKASNVASLVYNAVEAGSLLIPPKPPREKDYKPPGLSSRQREILLLIAQGYTSAGIGQELGTWGMTIAREIKEIQVKLGADNRAQAVYNGLEQGVLPLPRNQETR